MSIVRRGKIRELYQACLSKAGGNHARAGVLFEGKILNQLGLADEHGGRYRDRAGNPIVQNAHLSRDDFSFKELAEGLLGSEATDIFFNDERAEDLTKIHKARISILEGAGGDRRALLENTGVGIDPSAFSNINTYTSVVGGLVERAILDGFNNPAYIWKEIFAVKPTKSNGQKLIGVTPLGDVARRRNPNREHARAQFEERYVTTPETYENALAVDVTKEAVHFDLTGQILDQAAQVGDAVALRWELECIDVLLGVTNNFNFNGSAINTYQTSRTSGILNDHSNPFYDWTDLNEVYNLFAQMQDPKTGLPILVNPDLLVCMPWKKTAIDLALGADSIQMRTGSGSTTPQTTSMPLVVSNTPSNPYRGRLRTLTSPYLLTRARAADGLNLGSDAIANEYYWVLESQKAFYFMQNWPLTTTQAVPTNYEMIDKGLVASYFANMRGVPASVRPWSVIRNKN